MNPLNRQWFFRGFQKQLLASFGNEKANTLWANAGVEYAKIMTSDDRYRTHKGRMAIPAVALYKAISADGLDAEEMLNAFGDRMGRKFAKAVHVVTSVPGVSRLLWRHIAGIMDRMSGEKNGYRRRIVSKPPEMYGVDILSCPYHEICRELGCEKAVLCICHMDKQYMQGFRHIRYERTTAVSEGAECCDYRLRYDFNKK